MKVLNLLTAGGLGGIEILNYDIGKYSNIKQGFAFLFGTGPTYERMKEANYVIYDLSKYGKKITRDRFVELAKVAREYDAVSVHHGDPYLKLYYIYLVKCCGKTGVTFIHSCWDDTLFFPTDKVKYFIGKRLFQVAMDVSRSVVFVSKAGEKSYSKNFKMNKNATVIYNGIGFDKIEDGRNNIIIKKNPTELVYVGRLEKIKGIEILLEALYGLKSSYSFHLNIVGNGSERKTLEKKAESLGISDQVDFLGGKTDIKPYLRNAEIFIYPSVCQEVFGISIVEAMAYGLICVANNVGGIPEVLQNEYNGFLNKTNDTEGLMSSLKQAFNILEKGDYSELTHNAKLTAEKYSISNTCKQIDALYEGIIDWNGL